MKRSFVNIGSRLLLLTLAIGCKHEQQPEEPTPNLTTCRIVKETYKSIWLEGPQEEAEEITVEGRKFRVVKQSDSRYTYDAAGRLKEENIRYTTLGSTSRLTYQYSPSQILKKGYYNVPKNGGYYERTDTIVLNAQGLALKQNGLDSKYDKDSYLVSRSAGNQILETYTIISGNTVRMYYTNPTSDIQKANDVYIYDLNDSSVPTLLPFYGQQSKNLLKKHTQSIEVSTNYTAGPVYEKNYYYNFDKYGRVKRRIVCGNRLNPLWTFESSTGGIGVTDYEYECL